MIKYFINPNMRGLVGFNTDTEEVLAKGLCERIGIDGKLTHKPQNGKPTFEKEIDFPTHKEAIAAVLEKLASPEYGVVNSMSEIGAVGHRVLHGGIKFTKSCLVDDACEEAIKECFPLGPLHNPANLMGIKACQDVMPGTPQVAVFDTSFGMDMDPKAYMYALPYEWYTKYKMRRYGAHGTSYLYNAKRAAALLGKNPFDCNLIICHIGNGSSMNAVKNGLSFDTSMGLTPLEGLVMGTRCGDFDASVAFQMMERENISPSEMYKILNKKSGVLGITEKYQDSRDVEINAEKGDEKCKLAIEMETYRMRKYIGAYAAALEGKIDAVVFTAGVGENSKQTRKEIVEMLRARSKAGGLLVYLNGRLVTVDFKNLTDKPLLANTANV